MTSLEGFLKKKPRLNVNRTKSAVGRPWKRKLLGYSFTTHRETKLKVSSSSLKRLKAKLREVTRTGRGRNLVRTIGTLTPLIRGWGAYYRLAEVRGSFRQLDEWLRRRRGRSCGGSGSGAGHDSRNSLGAVSRLNELGFQSPTDTDPGGMRGPAT